ncbi:SIR2 family protein [Myxococcus xanthus]|uniref:SIR2 family protein n=1 Tax=Myxococcus xanthus TaxID=34 RepID=UPI001165A70E|nr:SIR2 family protein [Myxococcus xanthus]QDE84705.1 hypothetical protein BHS07_25885 [Myxococcus xanthus]
MTVIDKATLLNNFQREMDSDTVAFFLGAGMSLPSGFVNWKELMRDIAEELRLDINRETDLIALAQYHKNTRKTRHRINQLLVTEFTKDARITENHRLLASLPVSAVWTTNYDQIIEQALKEAHKRVDVKRRDVDLAHTQPRTDVVLYKMHGDVDAPDEAVLTKDDYAAFEAKRGLFSIQLRGHLVSRSFLFLGYSFSDPNMDHILARIRALLGENKREHYCIMRKVMKNGDMTDADVDYQSRLLNLRIQDLQNYGIQTLLIEDFCEITEILSELNRRSVRKNVFVSGSATEFTPLGKDRLERFSRTLGQEIIRRDCNLISGIGLGIGGAVMVGALEELYASPATQLQERAVLRPFPQVQPERTSLDKIWERYRQEMLSKAGFAVFIAGNKINQANDRAEDADGVIREFEIAVQRGVYPIPVGATGHAASDISKQVLAEPEKYFRAFAPKVTRHLETLTNESANDADWLNAIFSIIKTIAPK